MSALSKKGGLAAHWDWLAASLGILVLALAVVLFILAFSSTDDSSSAVTVPRPRKDMGVQMVDTAPYEAVTKAYQSPGRLLEPPADQGSFLASETRVFCQQGDPADARVACARPIPFGLEKCPYCGVTQPKEEKPALDSDGDGLPDEWEIQYGLDPKDPADVNKDKDGDGFTNLEEFEAKTDPTDPSSHPPYLDFLKIAPPLKQTFMPFYFVSAREVPAGMKLEFKDPARTKEYDRGIYSVLVGEAIGKTGYVLKKYDHKVKKIPIKGSNVSREKDVSEAIVERTKDAKRIALVVGVQQTPVDTQAKLVFSREGGKEFSVVRGSEIELYGALYRVKTIEKLGSTIQVGIEDAQTGDVRILKETLD